MAYRPEAVANAFIGKSFRDEIPIDPMKAQKLTYFAHGYYLALTGKPLIDRIFQAWKLGPVVPDLYQELKAYKGSEIEDYILVPTVFTRRKPKVDRNDDDFVEVRDFVWATYGETDSIDLSKLTHKTGYAWDRAIKANPGIKGPPILNSEIQRDFEPLVRRDGRIRAHT